MRRALLGVFLVASIFGLEAETGTFYQGVKVWWTFWDSVVMDNLKQTLEEQGFEADAPTGTGFLMGPVYGYQAPSGRWSLSLAMMLVSNFDQNASADLLGLPMKIFTRLKRTDVDLAFTYSVSSYLKLYAGCKYMQSSFDIFVDYSPTASWFSQPVTAVIPVLGAGFSYPLTEQLSVSGQAGGRYAFYTIDLIDNKSGQRQDPGSVRNPWGLAAEATLNYLAFERLFVQAGYRYEWLHITTKSNGMEFGVDDQAHGPVLAVVYLHR